MSVTLDANVLLYASDERSPRHEPARELVTRLARGPGLVYLFWQVYQDLVVDDAIRGNLVTDSHIAALMRQHGVRTIYTADRDFRRFTGINAHDPASPDSP